MPRGYNAALSGYTSPSGVGMAGLGGLEQRPEAPRGWLALSGGSKSRSTPWTAPELLCIALASRFHNLYSRARLFPLKPQAAMMPPTAVPPELTAAACAAWNAVLGDFEQNGESGLIRSNLAASLVWGTAQWMATKLRPLAPFPKIVTHFAGPCPDAGSFGAGGGTCGLCLTETEVYVLASPSHPRAVVARLSH